DSSPETGSIGAVIDAALASGAFRRPELVAAAQPEFGRYTMFSHHFARDLDEIHRLDRHPPMRDHPVTPADESDLRIQLSRQTDAPIETLNTTVIDETELLARWRSSNESTGIVLADAITDDDLRRLARLLPGGPRPSF